MARRKAERPAERGARRAETNVVAAYLTALRAPKVPARSRAKLEQRRAQVEEWLSEESSPIREVELIQRGLDIDAQIDQAKRLGPRWSGAMQRSSPPSASGCGAQCEPRDRLPWRNRTAGPPPVSWYESASVMGIGCVLGL